MTTWGINEYINWIENGCKLNTSVAELDLYDSGLYNLSSKISNLPQLSSIGLSRNHISSLPKTIGKLIHLKFLSLESNLLKYLPDEIGDCKMLTMIGLSRNRLEFLPSTIGNLRKLQCLWLSDNRLHELPEDIYKLQSLTDMWIDNNRFNILPINPLLFRNLKCFIYDMNLHTTMQITESIYHDKQSVHDSNIQQSIIDSLNRLYVKYNIDSCDFQNDDILSTNSKAILTNLCKDDTIHSVLNFTFRDVFSLVWNCICSNTNKNEIKHVLDNEIDEFCNVCFTGRVSRLVNCLSGFDPDVSITISDNEQINNIIIFTRAALIEQGEYTLEYHRESVKKRLMELGYQTNIIEQWIGFIE